jgi:hypothetical protein
LNANGGQYFTPSPVDPDLLSCRGAGVAREQTLRTAQERKDYAMRMLHDLLSANLNRGRKFTLEADWRVD